MSAAPPAQSSTSGASAPASVRTPETKTGPLPAQHTPYGEGTSNRSDAIVTGGAASRVDDIKHPLAYDIEDAPTCTIDEMLTALLVYTLPVDKRQSPPSDLLEKFLNAVLPICDSVELRDSLEQYRSGKGNENTRYGYLVNVLNISQECLRNVNLTDLKASIEPDKSFIFHVYDKPTQNKNKGVRKPDIVGVCVPTVSKAWDNGSVALDWTNAGAAALKTPENSFSWTDILTSWEIKVKGGKKNASVPPVYEIKYDHPIIAALEVPPKWRSDYKPSSLPEPEESEPGPIEESSGPTSASRPTRSGTAGTHTSGHSATGKGKGKRQFGSGQGGSDNKKKRLLPLATSSPLPPVVQAAQYALERLSTSWHFTHVINTVVIEDEIHIIWYDRQGAIQSQGLNFIKDLPRLLVLLLALQRFDDAAWGVSPLWRAAFNPSAVLSVPTANGPPVEVNLKHGDVISRHYGLFGRATTVIGGTSSSARPGKPGESLEGTEIAIKISWPEKSRTSEADVLEKVDEAARRHAAVKGHVPNLLHAYEVSECETSHFRCALGIADPVAGCRVLRIMLFKRLLPIKQLVATEFEKAMSDCFICHYCLWTEQIRHRDISIGNLMYYKDGDVVMGVLNDYDLASIGAEDQMHNTERTGTQAFMALDLLTDEGWHGRVTHLYRHEVESFVWVALWAALLYHQGKRGDNDYLLEWMTVGHSTCLEKKNVFWTVHFKRAISTASHSSYWPRIKDLLVSQRKHFMDRIDAPEEQPLPERPDEEWFQEVGPPFAVGFGEFMRAREQRSSS